jgi:hypothetical protein
MNTIIDLQCIKRQRSALRASLKPVHTKRSAGELGEIREPRHYVEGLADDPAKAPKLGKRDAAKAKALITAIRSARQSASHHLANSSHWVQSKRTGWERIDRIGALTNAIERWTRISPKALTGGAKVQQALLDLAWVAYADLEVHGYDNAHYMEANIPADERMEIADDGHDIKGAYLNDYARWGTSMQRSQSSLNE